MKTIFSVILLLFLVCSTAAFAQRQLVLLKGEKVKLRLYPGDEFVYRLKGSKKIYTSYVNNVMDTAVMVHQDIIPFHKIDRVYFRQSSFANVIGGLLVTGGVGYFLIDFVNVALVQGDKYETDGGVTKGSISLVAVGLPMLLIHKKSQRIKGRFRLLKADKESPFFLPDLNRFIE